MNLKYKGSLTTETYDCNKIDSKTKNIYKAISIIGKRSKQINQNVKEELINKLEEFASHSNSLEEVFENREQIEVSKYYERLPKPTSIAIREWLDDEIYYRKP